MKFHELELTSKKKGNRVGRGISAGQGKTAGRGTKGQKARTGKKLSPGFEGGQTKLSLRLPKKRGFTAKNPVRYEVINLDDLAQISSAKINNEALHKAGMIKRVDARVKLLGDGEVTKAYQINLAAISKTAQAQVSKAGGSFEVAAKIKRSAKATVAKSSPTRDNSPALKN